MKYKLIRSYSHSRNDYLGTNIRTCAVFTFGQNHQHEVRLL